MAEGNNRWPGWLIGLFVVLAGTIVSSVILMLNYADSRGDSGDAPPAVAQPAPPQTMAVPPEPALEEDAAEDAAEDSAEKAEEQAQAEAPVANPADDEGAGLARSPSGEDPALRTSAMSEQRPSQQRPPRRGNPRARLLAHVNRNCTEERRNLNSFARITVEIVIRPDGVPDVIRIPQGSSSIAACITRSIRALAAAGVYSRGDELYRDTQTLRIEGLPALDLPDLTEAPLAPSE